MVTDSGSDVLPRRETFRLGDRQLPRLFNGLWQLSSNSWGSAPAAKIRRQMATYAENGYTAFGGSVPDSPVIELIMPYVRYGKGLSARCVRGDSSLLYADTTCSLSLPCS